MCASKNRRSGGVALSNAVEASICPSRYARPQTADEVPLRIAIPAFILAELRTAFQMGLTILLPFLVIDLIAAAVLTSLGMVMVPPSTVALPLKLLVFVMVDGWHLVVQSLLRGAVA